MGKFRAITHSIILLTTPSLFAYPQDTNFKVQKVSSRKLKKNFRKKERYHLLTYDQILTLFAEIESGRAEKKYREKDLKRINKYLTYVAEKGILPQTNTAALQVDILELLSDDQNTYEFAYAIDDAEFSIVPAINYDQNEFFLCKNIFSKKWKNTKNFFRKHKKEIIIGAVIVLAVSAVAVTIIACSSAGSAVAAAAGAAKAAVPNAEPSFQEKANFSSAEIEIDLSNAPTFQAEMDNQVLSFKENLVNENFFGSTSAQSSWEETGRVLGPLFAHKSLHHFQNRFANDPQLSQEIRKVQIDNNLPITDAQNSYTQENIDHAFSTNYSSLFSNQPSSFSALSHQTLGERYYNAGHYQQAVHNLDRAIELEPKNPFSYLSRGLSYFQLDQYDHALEDFQTFSDRTTEIPSFSVSEFSLGFAKGLPQGVYESGEGILLFLAEFVSHPVHTSTQVVEALTTLVNLARNDEWGVIGEVLSPEIHQLVKEWDTLPSDQRGELAGYALGKHGADIIVPGALAKVASRSAQSAKELVAVCKNLKIAQETLILETAAELGGGIKAGEIINAGRTNAFLGEELGISAKEMGQLQKTGKLESTINSRLDRLVSQSESEVLKEAMSKDSHVKMVRDYLEKPAKDIQKGIKSYDKLITEHMEKIKNPSKFIPHWDKLHPERKHALINKKWPTEIECYTEQRDLLQSILNERIK